VPFSEQARLVVSLLWLLVKNQHDVFFIPLFASSSRVSNCSCPQRNHRAKCFVSSSPLEALNHGPPPFFARSCAPRSPFECTLFPRFFYSFFLIFPSHWCVEIRFLPLRVTNCLELPFLPPVLQMCLPSFSGPGQNSAPDLFPLHGKW